MSENPFGFGFDPDEIQRAMAQFADQAQKSQVVAWADNAINLAVQMTVASITRLDVSGTAEEQAHQVRQAIGIIFPEAVTLVREARQGLT